MEQLLENDDIVAEAIRNVEQNGIVFIDEIDKYVRIGHRSAGGAMQQVHCRRFGRSVVLILLPALCYA